MSDELPIPLPKKPAPAPELPAPPPEDTGSRALSDALTSSFRILQIVMAGLFILFLCSGIFTVDPQHKAIILRLGKPVGEGEQALLGPGIHWAFPSPIDEKVFIPVTTIQIARSTVGWYTTPEMEAAHTEPPPGPSLNPATDSYALTSDANIIHVRAALRYRITDPIGFHYNFANSPLFITNALNNALLYATAHFTVDDALTRRSTLFRESVAARAKELIDAQRLGVVIEQLDVDAIPPRQCEAKFAEVLQAGIKAHETSTKAQTYANEVLSKARAESESRINIAEADRTRLVGQVAAEAKQFSDLLPQYQANPELFARLRQTEVIGRVLANAQQKWFLTKLADGKSKELRLELSREPQKMAEAQP